MFTQVIMNTLFLQYHFCCLLSDMVNTHLSATESVFLFNSRLVNVRVRLDMLSIKYDWGNFTNHSQLFNIQYDTFNCVMLFLPYQEGTRFISFMSIHYTTIFIRIIWFNRCHRVTLCCRVFFTLIHCSDIQSRCFISSSKLEHCFDAFHCLT